MEISSCVQRRAPASLRTAVGLDGPAGAIDAAGTPPPPLEFPSRESVGIAQGNRKQRMKPTAENHG
jgi:hypothetical protein